VEAGVWDCCVMAALSVMERMEDLGGSRPNRLFMIVFLLFTAHVHEQSNRREGIRQPRNMRRGKQCQNHASEKVLGQQRPLVAHAARILMNLTSSTLIVGTRRSQCGGAGGDNPWQRYSPHNRTKRKGAVP